MMMMITETVSAQISFKTITHLFLPGFIRNALCLVPGELRNSLSIEGDSLFKHFKLSNSSNVFSFQVMLFGVQILRMRS